MRKLFNFNLGGNETSPNIKEKSATSSICVCVCVFLKFFFYYMKQRAKKINLKKLCIK